MTNNNLNLINLDIDEEAIDENYLIRPEIALWKAVILQAFIDSISRNKSNKARIARVEARKWLRGLTDDFETVCLLAGISKKYIIKKAKEIVFTR